MYFKKEKSPLKSMYPAPCIMGWANGLGGRHPYALIKLPTLVIKRANVNRLLFALCGVYISFSYKSMGMQNCLKQVKCWSGGG